MFSNLFFFEPDRDEVNARIPVRGYSLIGLLIPSVDEAPNTHVVRLGHAREKKELKNWSEDWQRRFAQSQQIISFVDSSLQSYWKALRSLDDAPRNAIRAAVSNGAVARPFEWTNSVRSEFENLHIPSRSWHGEITPTARRRWEYALAQQFQQHHLPTRLLAPRRRIRGTVALQNYVRALERRKTPGAIEITLEGSTGGVATIVIDAAAGECPEFHSLIRECPSNSFYFVIPQYRDEQRWSLHYEMHHGQELFLGMSEKRHRAMPDGRSLHYGSIMGRVIPSIRSQDRNVAQRLSERLLEEPRRKHWTGNAGFVWRSSPRAKVPELLYRIVRDESETIPHTILQWIEKTTGRKRMALHRRMYFRGLDWEDVRRRLGEGRLFSRSQSEGVLLHLPYFSSRQEAQKGKRGVKTILLMCVGRSLQALEKMSAQTQRRLNAWGPGERS